MADFTKLTEYLNSLGEKYGIPSCDMAVFHNHREVYRHMCGYSDLDKTVPVSKNDMYWIYSASKVITCTAVMQLIERGQLALDDELRKYLPEFGGKMVDESGTLMMPMFPGSKPGGPLELRPAKREIRIADLMSMQAGLTYNYRTPAIEKVKAETDNKATTRQIIAALSESPLAYHPGDHWVYSLAHDVLGAVVEVVSGMRFSEYLRKNIFDPLGITDFTFKLNDAQRARLSALYRCRMNDGTFEHVPGDNMFDLSDEYESGGAGLACTVDAYGTFVDAMCNGGVGANGNRILSEESIDRMRENRLTGQSLEDFMKAGKGGYGYGLGVRTLIDASKSRSPIGEFGWDGAAGAYVVIDRENHLGIYFALHTLMFIKSYFEIHPMIRDLTYEALQIG